MLDKEISRDDRYQLIEEPVEIPTLPPLEEPALPDFYEPIPDHTPDPY
jgi:hypothetical protein